MKVSRTMKRLIVIFLMLAGATAVVNATDVCGNVSGIWTLSGSPYYVNCDITVPTAQTLAIGPGVQILFTGHFKFIVNGNLQAIGTEQDSIVFTRAYDTEASKWWGIRFINSAGSQLSHSLIEYGHATGDAYDDRGGGIYCFQSSPLIEKCTIRNNVSDIHGGAVYTYGTCSPNFNECLIYSNIAGIGGGAIECDVNSSPIFTRCLIYGNSAGSHGGAVLTTGSQCAFTRCTINANADLRGQFFATANSAVTINSTIISNSDHFGLVFEVPDPNAQAVTYCDIWGNLEGICQTGCPPGLGANVTVNGNGDSCDVNQNISLDPEFFDEQGNDFHVLPTSPCINAGDPSLPVDPDGSTTEIGALYTSSRGLNVIFPNGSESWRIGDVHLIGWIGSGFDGGIRVELNRAYPYDTWEMLFADTPNDGEELWTVIGPASGNCRIRISAIDDTLADVSDNNFEITADLTLLDPNGGEQWSVFHQDTIRWVSGGFDLLLIELNRDFSSGVWEVLADSTENDGEFEWFVTDPLSDHCRIRVSAVGDTFSDISDGDFSITSSQGYLALARQTAPDSPVLNWDAGTVECPEVQSEVFWLKNFGSEAIVVFQPEEPSSVEFSRETNCDVFFALAPGQMSACSLTLAFDPANDGMYFDTLLIQTDAVNQQGGYVRIPLAGEQISTPATPQVVITIEDQDAVLHWNAVTESIGGCPVIVTGYLVFYSPTSEGTYYYHGFTSDTTYTHVRAAQFTETMFYQVVAYTGEVNLAGLEEGMAMEAALEAMSEESKNRYARDRVVFD